MRKSVKTKTAKTPVTALARRQAAPAPRRAATALVVNDPQRMLPAGVLGDEAAVGALGQVEVKLTREEERILDEPVDVADVRMKPTGQPYLCLHPDTRVLTTALEWVPIRKIRVGDSLVSVDEHLPGLRHRRKMRPATVTAMAMSEQEQFLVTLESGREVICSAEHRWLSRRSQNIWQWRPLRAIKAGDELLGLGKPWDATKDRTSGWLAGIYDGEGALVDTRTPRPGEHPDRDGTRGRFGVFFSQNMGPVLDQTIRLLQEHGFTPTAPRRHGFDQCRTIEITGLYQTLRFLGSIRPLRLLGRSSVLWTNKTFMGCDERIASIKSLGLGELVDITTSTGTFLAEGLVSHNSHPAYTRWFNRAFGRLGWAIVPQSKPIRTASGKKISVVCPYMLYIHGKPAAFAMGEQEYFEDSREQTYGDALEATVASALRRCAKRLGVGLELWDKRWLTAFIENQCIPVKVKSPRDDKPSTKWRRKNDPALPWEIGGKGDARDRDIRDDLVAPDLGDFTVKQTTVVEPKGDPKITIEQRKRLGQIVKSSGRNEPEVRLWLKKTYNVKSEDILRKDYQRICDQLQVRGTLPLPGDGGQ